MNDQMPASTTSQYPMLPSAEIGTLQRPVCRSIRRRAALACQRCHEKKVSPITSWLKGFADLPFRPSVTSSHGQTADSMDRA